jgi:hypothetical protein
MPLRMAEQGKTVDATATNGAALGISVHFFIEQERHRVTNGGAEHVTTWKLSPASGGYSQFWELGTSVLAVCPACRNRSMSASR